MIRIKKERRANQQSENPVKNRIFNRMTALSLSVAALTFFGANRVSATDVPLPIKKIALNSENQIVVYFGKREGEFPSPPHLLETPGPNHRIVLEFNDATVDKINMPAAADLSTKLHKQLAAIKSIRYSTVVTGDAPKARVVIEIPEQLKVRPRVVKLEEESVTINLGDDIVEQSSALEEQTKGRVQSMEPAASAVVAQAKAPVSEASADMTPEPAGAPTPAATTIATADAVIPTPDAATTATPEAPTPADSAPVAAAAPGASEAPPAVQAVSAAASVKTASAAPAPAAPVLRPEESEPTPLPATASVVAEEKRREAAEAAVETEAGITPAAAGANPTAKAKPAPALTKRVPESLANASANLKKFMRWPHKNDSDSEKAKPSATPKSTAKASTRPPAPSRIASEPDESSIKPGSAPPEGAEFNFGADQSSSSPDKIASVDSTKTTPAAAQEPAAPPGGWDWTASTKAASQAKSTVTNSEAVQVAAGKVDAAQPIAAATGDATQTPVSASVSGASAAVTEAANSAPVAVAETPNVQPTVVAQMEAPVDDRPKISTPIESTETKNFNEPAQVVAPGASTSMTAGAADVIKAKTPEAKKPTTVAETDAADFAEALKPVRRQAKTETEVAPTPESPLIRDTEMSESPKVPEAETASVETPKAPAVPSLPPVAEETVAPDSNKAALALYNDAVKAHLAGNLPKAISDYKGALAANPELAEAHSNLGLIFNQQHQYALAVSEFRKALAINPKDAITYNGIGAALRAQKDLMGAIKNWQTAVSLDPKLATAHYNLGVAYELQRDYDKAMASYDEAVKCDYRLGEAYYRMGLILEKRHRNEEAKAKFKSALKASENSEYSADARQQIALLEGKTEKTVK